MDKKIISVFEKVDFPEFDIRAIQAKIDSGAYTGSLHCTKVIEENVNDKTVIHFSPFDYPNTKITTSKFKISSVKSSNGSIEDRYFIKTLIRIRGESFPIELSLADRSTMKWPLLIGRKFLRKNKFLVDFSKPYPMRRKK